MKPEEIARIRSEAEANLMELGHVPATARDLCNLLKLCDEVERLRRALRNIMGVVGTNSLQHKIAREALGGDSTNNY
jgi:hypothetical protein